MDYSGFHEMYVLHLLAAVRMWLDNIMLTSIYPALQIVEDMIYYGVLLVYPTYFVGFHIYKHRSHWSQPDEQKRIIVLISIPVVIGIVSWVTLHVNEDHKTIFILLDSIKECSAGLGFPMFMGLMQAYMKINTSKLSPDGFRHKIRERLIYNVFPVTLVQPRCVLLDQNNLELLNFWTWQYVVIRLVCTVLMIAFQLCWMYPLWVNWVFFFILNVSAAMAYYTAYAFYRAFVQDFPHSSYCGFRHFRWIFFVCFWQGGVFKVLVGISGLVKGNHLWWQELHNSLLVLETIPFTYLQWEAYCYSLYDTMMLVVFLCLYFVKELVD